MLTLPTRARRRRRDDWHRSGGGVWLPGAAGAAGAADVPRVAGDPMRGAGMVRRGMGFGFEPAGCCCGEGETEGCGDYGPMLYDPANQYIVVSVEGAVGTGLCAFFVYSVNRDHELSQPDWAGYSYGLERQSCSARWQRYVWVGYGTEAWTLTFSLTKAVYPVGSTYRRIRFEYVFPAYGSGECGWVFELEDGTYERWPNEDGASWELFCTADPDAVATLTIYDEEPSV